MAIIKGKLKEAREDAQLSQGEIAKKLGLSQGAYSDFERGKTRLDVNYLVKLSDILNKPVTWFLGIENHDGKYLSSDETELLNCYRSLSHTSKQYVFNFAQDLSRREKEQEQ